MTGGNKIIQVYSPLHDFHPHSVVLPALDKPRFLMHMTLVGHGRLSASRHRKSRSTCILFRSVIVEAWILCPKTCTLCPKTGFEYLNWTESLFCLGLSVSSPLLQVIWHCAPCRAPCPHWPQRPVQIWQYLICTNFMCVQIHYVFWVLPWIQYFISYIWIF